MSDSHEHPLQPAQNIPAQPVRPTLERVQIGTVRGEGSFLERLFLGGKQVARRRIEPTDGNAPGPWEDIR